jgi:hypothetical protein
MKFKYVKQSLVVQNDLELALFPISDIPVSRIAKYIKMSGSCEF